MALWHVPVYYQPVKAMAPPGFASLRVEVGANGITADELDGITALAISTLSKQLGMDVTVSILTPFQLTPPRVAG